MDVFAQMLSMCAPHSTVDYLELLPTLESAAQFQARTRYADIAPTLAPRPYAHRVRVEVVCCWRWTNSKERKASSWCRNCMRLTWEPARNAAEEFEP